MATIIEVEMHGGCDDPKYSQKITHVKAYDGMTPAFVLSKFNKMHGTEYRRVFASGAHRYEDVTNFAMMPESFNRLGKVLLVTKDEEKLLAFPQRLVVRCRVITM